MAGQVEGVEVVVAQRMRHEEVHHRVRVLGREVLLDLLQAVLVAFFLRGLRDQLAPVGAEDHAERCEEPWRRHAAGAHCVAVVRQHHARHDGAQMRWPVLRGCQLRRPAVGRADHAYLAVGPGLCGRKLDGFGAVPAELRPGVFEAAFGAAGARGADAHHRVAGLDEPLVEGHGHRGLVLQVGRAADRAGVITVEGQGHGEFARRLGQQRGVAQLDAVGGGDVAADALGPEGRKLSIRGEGEPR